jgi:hypothetical protein
VEGGIEKKYSQDISLEIVTCYVFLGILIANEPACVGPKISIEIETLLNGIFIETEVGGKIGVEQQKLRKRIICTQSRFMTTFV